MTIPEYTPPEAGKTKFSDISSDMHEVSGQGEVDTHHYGQNNVQDAEVVTELTPKEGQERVIEEKLTELIRNAPTGNSPEVRQSLDMIEQLPEAAQAELRALAAEKVRTWLEGDPVLARYAVWMIDYLPQAERSPLIRKVFESDPMAARLAVDMIRHLPEAEQAELQTLAVKKVRT